MGKRPMSAYFIFSNEMRPRIQQELGTIAKKVKELWANLTDSDKGTYQAKADKAKAAYQIKLEQYRKSEQYAQYQERLSAFKLAKKLAKKAMKEEAKAEQIPKRKK